MITTVIGRGVPRAGDRRRWWGCSTNPYAGLVVFVALPARVRARAAADPGRACGCSAASCGAIRERSADWPVLDFRAPEGPPHGPRHRGAHRRQSRHPAARRLRQPALDGIAGVLRPDVPHADAPAVHRLAGGAAFARRLRRVPHRRRRAGRSCTASWPACDSSCTCHQLGFRSRSRRGADMPPGAQAEICGSCHPPDTRRRRSHPRHSRVRRRRNEHRDGDDAADARRRPDSRSPRAARSTGTPIPAIDVEYMATDAGPADDSRTCKVTDAKGQVKEYVADGRDRSRSSAPAAAQDGLHRLPQRGRSSASRRRPSRPSIDAIAAGGGEPRPAVRAARRAPAAEGGRTRARTRARRRSTRACGRSISRGAAPSTQQTLSQAVDARPGRVPPQRVSRR